MGFERNISEDLGDSGELERNVLDVRDRELLSFVNKSGPSNIRCLIDVGGFNYTTYRPHWEKLLGLHLFRMDSKKRLCLTPEAGSFVISSWGTMTIWERCEATHQDNLGGLGLLPQMIMLLKQAYPGRPLPRDLVPHLLESGWAQDLIGCIKELNLDNPDERRKGLGMLYLLATGQNPLDVWRAIQHIDVEIVANLEHWRAEQGILGRISDRLFGWG